MTRSARPLICFHASATVGQTCQSRQWSCVKVVHNGKLYIYTQTHTIPVCPPFLFLLSFALLYHTHKGGSISDFTSEAFPEVFKYMLYLPPLNYRQVKILSWNPACSRLLNVPPISQMKILLECANFLFQVCLNFSVGQLFCEWINRNFPQ